jgi:hypothetical protein
VEEAAGAVSALGAEREVDAASLAESAAFDDLLARAVPRPATREQFRALTGWSPTVQLPSPGDDLDPLRSAALSRELPGLAEALTGSAMAPRLQRMLADDWELLACSPGKPIVEPGKGAGVQYRLELRRRGSAETEEHLVAGRLSPTMDAAEGWLSQVAPLADRLDDRDDLRAFARPALLVPDLLLVLHAFPLDPTLPGLMVATDAAALVDMLGPVLTSSVPGLLLQGCHTEVVRYGRGRCVLRYELAWQLQHSRRSLKQVMYGKAYADGRGRLVGPAVTALRRPPDGPGSSLPFSVPRFQAYLPDLRLALLEGVPGSPLLPGLIRGRGADGAPPGPGPEAAVAACARIAAALHGSAIPVGATRTLPEEIEGARAAVDALAPMAPALAASLRGHLRACGDAALDPPEPLGVAHGNFEPARVLFDGPTTSLVDFDTVCLAEPALDLGQFTAHFAVAASHPPDPAGPSRNGGADLGSAFLREYLRLSSGSDPDVLLSRVAAYRTVALTRLAVRRWCQLAPQRLRPVLTALGGSQRIRVP